VRHSAVILGVACALGCAGVARAQTPPPPAADAPTPGAGQVEGDVTVTRKQQVRVRVRCILGEAQCSGKVALRTARPMAPGKGKVRRMLRVASGKYGPMQPGEIQTLSLTLHRDVRARVRNHRSTAITWDTYAADGTKNFLFVPHGTTLVSRLAR